MSTAAAANRQDGIPAKENTVPLPLRGDTFLGVFEAIGQDLGINPNWLRIPFAALMLWNAEVIIIAYFALGAVVAAARWFFPVAKAKPRAAFDTPAAANERADEELSIAA